MANSARPPRWEVPRPAASTRYLLDTARDHDIPDEVCLDGTGLRAGELDDPLAVVLPEQELRVIRNLLAQGGDPRDLGVETGLRYSLTSTGLLGYALLSSATLRDAIEVLSRFAVLLSVYFEVTYTETSAGIVVEVHDGDVPADVRPFLLARDMVAGYRVASLLLSSTVMELIAGMDRPIPLQFRGFRPGDSEMADVAKWAAAARALVAPFGLTLDIEFHAPRDAFTIPHEILDQAMPAPTRSRRPWFCNSARNFSTNAPASPVWRRGSDISWCAPRRICLPWQPPRGPSISPNAPCTGDWPTSTPPFAPLSTRSGKPWPSNCSPRASRSKRWPATWATPMPPPSPTPTAAGAENPLGGR
ncbi:hypothetical protein HLB23_20440 [Nocardia uniformis]|uniref:HTH-type transcriptional regulator AraC-type N-terminal domain-containing protein n=1 Tax=Nocardia uniformis TaxID=53432 RepID=A0A849C8I6_9NOCA|nr:AraC family transcriptional regulator ligand-binding domain-containing protein [Nocardia uniformis]NNH72197.1 hypothetical protein [Nocardia uniformis]